MCICFKLLEYSHSHPQVYALMIFAKHYYVSLKAWLASPSELGLTKFFKQLSSCLENCFVKIAAECQSKLNYSLFKELVDVAYWVFKETEKAAVLYVYNIRYAYVFHLG